MAHYLNDLPFTDEAKELNLPQNIIDYCRLVYKMNEQTNRLEFDSIWNKEQQYDDLHYIVPVTSTYGGIAQIPQNTIFYNVAGTSQDPKHDTNSWIGLMQWAYIQHNNSNPTNILPLADLYTCCTDGNYYDMNNNNVLGVGCNGVIVGGHVCLNQYEIHNPTNLYLLPICSRHNVKNFTQVTRQTGLGFYMKTRINIAAIILNNFMN